MMLTPLHGHMGSIDTSVKLHTLLFNHLLFFTTQAQQHIAVDKVAHQEKSKQSQLKKKKRISINPCNHTVLSLYTDLINIQNATLVVKPRVKLVQHGDDLHRCALGADSGETDNVREQHGDVVEFASGNRLTLPQFLCNITGKDGIKEIHRSPLFLLQSLVSPL